MWNILIADDETPIREWIASGIKEHPSVGKVYTANNGQEAIALVQKNKIDIVLTDITMPKVNGLELLRNIKALDDEIVVVIMSVHDEFKYAREALQLGAYDYVLKNEITKESLYDIMNNIFNNADETKKDGFKKSYNSQDRSLQHFSRSKYLKNIIVHGGKKISIEDLVENDIHIDDDFLIAIAMPNNPELLTKFPFEKKENLSHITFLTYSESGLLLIANTNSNDNTIVRSIVCELREVISGNVGYSNVVDGVENLYSAIRDAIDMRKYLFYEPGCDKILKNHSEEEKKTINAEIQNYKIRIVDAYRTQRTEKAIELFRELIEYQERIKLSDISSVKNHLISTVHQLYHNSQEWAFATKIFDDQVQQAKYMFEIIDLLEEIFVILEKQERYSDNISTAIKFISDNYMNSISLKDVAETAFLNEEYFSRLFKKEVGVNFTDYLNSIRMNEAKRILMTSDKKIAEIAEAVGVPNNKYFSLLYKKYFGVSPSVMRDQK